MKPVSRTLLLAFAALGIGASTAASYVHYKLLTDPSSASFCDVSAHVNCTHAYSSQYGSFMGVPVAPLGLLYFVFVLGICVVNGIFTPFNPNVSCQHHTGAKGHMMPVQTVSNEAEFDPVELASNVPVMRGPASHRHGH